MPAVYTTDEVDHLIQQARAAFFQGLDAVVSRLDTIAQQVLDIERRVCDLERKDMAMSATLAQQRMNPWLAYKEKVKDNAD